MKQVFTLLICFCCSIGYAQNIVIQEVLYNPSSGNDKIMFCNTTGGTIDISSWWLCYRFNYQQLSSSLLSIESGSLNLAGGDCVIIDMGANGFNNTSSDIGLYTTPSFGSTAAMHDFIQYGTSTNVGRANVAAAKGIWTEVSSNVYDFIGSSSSGQSVQFDGSNGGGGELSLSSDFSNAAPVLPVELTKFTAQQIGESITLNWETATELDNDYFAIERSVDGENFESIAQILGAGTSIVPQYYEFVDKNPTAATLYYRLKQVDLDGKFAYSEMVTVIYKKRINQIRSIAKNLYSLLLQEVYFDSVVKTFHITKTVITK